MKKIIEVFQTDLIYIPKKKESILFIIPIAIYLLYLLKILPYLYHGLDHNIFITLYSVTIGYKYVDPYISKVKNRTGNIFLIAFFIYFISMFFSLPGLLISGKDPQGLTNITTNFSSFIHIGLLKYIFVGIGEELFNFYILLTLISFIRGKNRLILSVLITCLIFGLLHGINWPILSAFFIAFGHIPYIYSYGKYKSLLPAMLAHVINNMLVAMTLIPGIESLVNFTIQITFFVFVFGFWNKAKAI